jgi:hypothetical protein
VNGARGAHWRDSDRIMRLSNGQDRANRFLAISSNFLATVFSSGTKLFPVAHMVCDRSAWWMSVYVIEIAKILLDDCWQRPTDQTKERTIKRSERAGSQLPCPLSTIRIAVSAR